MSLLNLLFPKRCIGCREIISDKWNFCVTCQESLLKLETPYCPVCSAPESPGLCFFCKKSLPPFEKVHAVYLFGGAIAEALHHFKYEDHPHLSKPIVQLIQEDIYQALNWCSLIVPIPLHERRLRKRGYDQASLLAQELAAIFHKRLQLGGLLRITHTAPQVGKNRSQRAANVQGAFLAVSERVKDQKILLVDDVLTTGATAAEATRTLRQAGAQAVQVLTIARAL